MMKSCSTILYVRSVAVLLLISLGATVTHAQSTRRLETGFERDVNRFRWTSDAHFAARVGGWDVALTNRFLSDAFILFDDELTFRDEDVLAWRAGRALDSDLSLRLRGRTAWFGQSRVLTQEVYGGLRIRPREDAWVEPVVGAAWDRRPGAVGPDGEAPLRLDGGPAFGLRLALAPQTAQDARLRMEGESTWQVIRPRRGRTLRFDGNAARTFESDTRLSSRLRVASLRRDTYQAVSFLNRSATGRPPESIEATTSDTLEVGVELDAPFYRSVRLIGRLDAEATNRFIRTHRAPEETLFFETDFRRRALDGEVGLAARRSAWTARFATRMGAATERRRLANREDLPPAEAAQKSNLLEQADYDEGTFALAGNARASLTSRLVLTFNGSSRIVRHDTPEANPDDRDEIYHNGELGVLLRLTRYLEADVKLFGSFYHTVYLNAERSAENNVQRSLRLRPSLRWTPSERTRIRLASEVRATYTVDDFVLQGRRPTDQSAREMRFEAEVEHDAGSGVRLLASGSYGDLRLGRLLWDDFAEIPFDTLRTYSGWLHVQAGQRLVADLGLRVFIRTDFDRATTVRYPRVDEAGNELVDENGQPILGSISRPGRKWIEQIGPTATISWTMAGASTLRLDGWLNVQHVYRRLYGALPDATADRIRGTAREGSRQIIPNLALSVVWNF